MSDADKLDTKPVADFLGVSRKRSSWSRRIGLAASCRPRTAALVHTRHGVRRPRALILSVLDT